jgi:DNA-binding transcriptional regulator YhcF (GntR family)
MPPFAVNILLAAWHSCGHVVGAACGTVRSLANAVGAEEVVTADALRALRDAGYVEMDGFGVVIVTAMGQEAARIHEQV